MGGFGTEGDGSGLGISGFGGRRKRIGGRVMGLTMGGGNVMTGGEGTF